MEKEGGYAMSVLDIRPGIRYANTGHETTYALPVPDMRPHTLCQYLRSQKSLPCPVGRTPP
eukprot:3002119-Rhodomonas_salina.3